MGDCHTSTYLDVVGGLGTVASAHFLSTKKTAMYCGYCINRGYIESHGYEETRGHRLRVAFVLPSCPVFHFVLSFAFNNGKMCASVSFAIGDHSGKFTACLDGVQARAKLDLASKSNILITYDP